MDVNLLLQISAAPAARLRRLGHQYTLAAGLVAAFFFYKPPLPDEAAPPSRGRTNGRPTGSYERTPDRGSPVSEAGFRIEILNIHHI